MSTDTPLDSSSSPSSIHEVTEQKLQSLDLSLEQDTNITLISQDGYEAQISLEFCKLSKLIDETVQSDPDCKSISFGEHIPCKEYLQTIVEYLTLRKGVAAEPIEEPLEFPQMSKVTDKDSAVFIDELYTSKGIYFLYDIISVSNYLAITSLLNLSCAKVASLVKNVPITQLPGILNPLRKPKKNFGFSSLEDGKVVFYPPSMVEDMQECKKQKLSTPATPDMNDDE